MNTPSVKQGAVNGEVIHDLLELCNEYFIDYMVQPYAGANRECLYCGATGQRDGSVDHSGLDCPIIKYRDLISKNKGTIR